MSSQSVTIEGDFLNEMPNQLSGAGTKLGHTQGPIQFRVIDGPVIQTGSYSFKWGRNTETIISVRRTCNHIFLI